MYDPNDPIRDNYYAFYLAIVYPYFLTADEALYAIKFGVNPLTVNLHTLSDALKLSKMKKEPKHLKECCGRRYEVIRMMADIINETNAAMRSLRDYELCRYRENIAGYMKNLRERMEKEKIR